MKIGINDLSVDVVNRITALDAIKNNYTEKNNIVMYDGKSFYTSNIDVPATEVTTVIKEVRPIIITTNDIAEMEKHLYKSADNYVSSYDTVFSTTTPFNTNTKNILSDVSPDFICRELVNVKSIKEINGYIYLLLIDGTFVMFDSLKPENQARTDILTAIKTNFACPKLTKEDINDVYVYTGGFLVPTKYNGIFHLDMSNDVYEMFPINNVISIEFLSDGNIACAINDYKNSIVFFNLDTKLKVETSNRINSNTIGQVPMLAKVYENNYYVLSKAVGMTPSENMLHMWKYNETSNEYTYSYVGKNTADNSYQAKILDINNKKVLISGIKDKKLFIWEYDTDEIENAPREYIFENICGNYSDLEFLNILDNGSVFLAMGNVIYELNDSYEVINHFRVPSYNANNPIIYSKNIEKFIMADNKELFYINTPTYKTYQYYEMTITNKASNNLTVLINSNNDNARAIFYDAKSLAQIIPDYYIITDGNSIIKIEDSDSESIKLRINIPNGTIINGVVINDNQRYVKTRK